MFGDSLELCVFYAYGLAVRIFYLCGEYVVDLEFNKEIFETIEDYYFEVSVCVVHKIIMENEHCTYKEIVLIANTLLPIEMFDFVKKEIRDVINVGLVLGTIKIEDNKYIITKLGVDELEMVSRDINQEHSSIINNCISKTKVDYDKRIIRIYQKEHLVG